MKENIQENSQKCSETTGGGEFASALALRERLIGALVGLARATEGDTQPGESTWRTIVEGLYTAADGMDIQADAFREMIDRVHMERAKLVPRCTKCPTPCGRNDDYDLGALRETQGTVRSLKELLLSGIKGIAVWAYQAAQLGIRDQAIDGFLAEALMALGEDKGEEALTPFVSAVERYNLAAVELLKKARGE